MIDHLAKTYKRVLEQSLKEIIESQLRDKQHGNRRGRSKQDLTFGEKIYDYNRRVYVEFVDLSKAFDKVPRRRLW